MIIKLGMEVEYDLFRRMLAAVNSEGGRDVDLDAIAKYAKEAAETAKKAGFVE